MSPEVSCRPMLGPVRARGWRGSKPFCGLLDIGVPLEVSQKVGKREKRGMRGREKGNTHQPFWVVCVLTNGPDSIQIRIGFYIHHRFVIFQGRTRKDWCKLSMKNGRASITCGLVNHWYLMRTLGNCSETWAKDGY